MTFLHPLAIWIGAFAAAGPIVIHLLTRPRPVRMPLSTLRFVREAVRQRRARSRLRDVLVLLLRTLAVLLLALAIARPQWGPKPLIAEGQEGDAVRVVILDLSQSMATVESGIEGLQRARTVAAKFLKYRPGLRANLILAAATAEPVFDTPSTNFDALRDELSQCNVLPERLDVNRAFDAAAQMLAPVKNGTGLFYRDGPEGAAHKRAPSPSSSTRRELVIISDFQRANWTKADFARLPADTQIQLESIAALSDTAEKRPDNLAILSVAAVSQGSGGRTAKLRVEVGNFSNAPRKVTVEVTLGASTWRLQGNCPKQRSTTLTQDVQLRDAGWQSGQARLVGVEDALAADNTRALVARVRPRPVVGLITRQPASDRSSTSAYLERALAKDLRVQERASVVRRIDPAAVDRSALAAVDLIVLDHPGKLSDAAIRLLAGLMRRGRPIIYTASEIIDATNLKQLATAAGSGLQMPVEFMPPPAGQRRRNLFLASFAQERSPFVEFGDDFKSIAGSLRFGGGLTSRRLEGGLQDDVLATYNDGSACMVHCASGAGSLAVINTDLAASNLPASWPFQPLMEHLAARMLRGRAADHTALCGEPLVAHLPDEPGSVAGLEISGPDREGRLRTEVSGGQFGTLSDEGVSAVWQWRRPNTTGVYEIRRDETVVFSLAMDIPAEESRLDSLPADVLTGRLAEGRTMYFRSAAGGSEQHDDSWRWFAGFCILCMLSELIALLGFRT